MGPTKKAPPTTPRPRPGTPGTPMGPRERQHPPKKKQ